MNGPGYPPILSPEVLKEISKVSLFLILSMRMDGSSFKRLSIVLNPFKMKFRVITSRLRSILYTISSALDHSEPKISYIRCAVFSYGEGLSQGKSSGLIQLL